ncbi:GNAT family N-acetyltransferase [Pseudomonas sp. KCJK8927]|uniref:GNAT family N-acetyltransferase n=1 Tax=Pseudomonas sp. KCJK8927 TaxID=3344560 RepID=UPI0039069879
MPCPSLPRAVTTQRTRLSRPTPAIASQLHRALLRSYALHQTFLAWAKDDWTLDEVRDSLEVSAEQFIDPDAEKRYFVLTPDNAEVVGCIGLRPGQDGYEVGYWVSQDHCGQGLMREALAGLLDAVEVPLWLTTDLANSASQRLAERVGFRREGCVQVGQAPGTPHALYRRTPTGCR